VLIVQSTDVIIVLVGLKSRESSPNPFRLEMWNNDPKYIKSYRSYVDNQISLSSGANNTGVVTKKPWRMCK